MDILFDTNFLLSCIQHKVDFIAECERLFSQAVIIIPQEVIDELRMITTRKGAKEKQAAFLLLKIIDKFQKDRSIHIEKSKSRGADDALLFFDAEDVVIATFDKELKKRFVRAGFLRIKGTSLVQI